MCMNINIGNWRQRISVILLVLVVGHLAFMSLDLSAHAEPADPHHVEVATCAVSAAVQQSHPVPAPTMLEAINSSSFEQLVQALRVHVRLDSDGDHHRIPPRIAYQVFLN